MSTTVQNILPAFNSLSPAEQREVAAEILRNSSGAGEISEAGFNEMAEELFLQYDAEESPRRNP